MCATSERNPAPLLRTVSLDTGHVASRFWSYTALRSPSPFPHTRPDRSWLAARPGSAPLNDLGRPALTAPGSTDVPEVSPPSLPSLSPSTRTTMPGRTSPFSGESTLRLTGRDRSATWCRVTYIVNTLYIDWLYMYVCTYLLDDNYNFVNFYDGGWNYECIEMVNTKPIGYIKKLELNL